MRRALRVAHQPQVALYDARVGLDEDIICVHKPPNRQRRFLNMLCPHPVCYRESLHVGCCLSVLFGEGLNKAMKERNYMQLEKDRALVAISS